MSMQLVACSESSSLFLSRSTKTWSTLQVRKEDSQILPWRNLWWAQAESDSSTRSCFQLSLRQLTTSFFKKQTQKTGACWIKSWGKFQSKINKNTAKNTKLWLIFFLLSIPQSSRNGRSKISWRRNRNHQLIQKNRTTTPSGSSWLKRKMILSLLLDSRN